MTELERLKEKFKECMTFVHPDPVPKQQLREMWRVWFMGAVSVMELLNLTMYGNTVMSQADQLHYGDPNWWPDKSFHWWEPDGS